MIFLAHSGGILGEHEDDENANNCQAALVTYVTAGFPKPEDTPDVLLAMERGGAGKFPQQTIANCPSDLTRLL